MPKGVYKRTKEMNTGKYVKTKEHKRKISKTMKGKKKSEATKKKMCKENDIISIEAIHYRAHQVDPKPTDGKCQICNQIANKKGITKLIHSNKDHSYRLPINTDEWWWIHQSCHMKYDSPKIWTPKRRKEQAERARELFLKNNPIKKPEAVEKMLKTRRKNKSKKANKLMVKKDTSQVTYWLNNLEV